MTDQYNPNLEDEIEDDQVEDEETADETEDLFGDSTFELPDPTAVITVASSAGDDRYVPAREAMSVGMVMAAADLRPNGMVEYFVNGSTITVNDSVAPGQTLTVVGSVKGGV
jgi:hypothetical protein